MEGFDEHKLETYMFLFYLLFFHSPRWCNDKRLLVDSIPNQVTSKTMQNWNLLFSTQHRGVKAHGQDCMSE
jgi:hypothetical protein